MTTYNLASLLESTAQKHPDRIAIVRAQGAVHRQGQARHLDRGGFYAY